MTISAAEFLETLSKSKVLEPDRLKAWQAGKNLNDGVSIANQLVRDRVLTEWQAKYLLTGRHQLFLGPYQLLERTHRDELGDRFLGIHSQLARKVDLQVLPADLTKDTIRRASFINRVRQTSVLDHPQLAHVYDIDQQGGRYFVVQEHIDGTQLGEIAPSDLTELKIASWLEDTLAGLKYAHANKISHGELEFDDLIVEFDQKVKVQNLATCQLRPNATNKFQPVDDFRAISRLFIQMVDRLPSDSSSATRTSLRSLISRLAFIESQSKDFEKQLLAWKVEARREAELAPPATRIAIPEFQDVGKPLVSEVVSNTTAAPATVRKANKLDAYECFENEPDSGDDLKEPGPFTKMAIDNPVGLLSSSFVASMLVAATATYAYFFFSPVPKKTIASKPAQQSVSDSKDEKKIEKSSKEVSLRQEEKRQAPERETLSNVADNKLAEFKKTMESDPVVPAPTPTTNASQPGTQTTPQTTTPDASNQVLVNSETTPPISTLIAETPKQDVPPAASPTSPANPPTESNTPAAPTAPDERTKEPFSKLPKTLALPAEDDATEKKFGEVFINDRFLLGAEILSPPEISPQKILFQMERDEADKQRWIISFLRNPKDRKTAVAVFKKVGSELFFQWLPEAKGNRHAGFLRNCLLKLFTTEHSAHFLLREPIEIEPMILQEKQLTAKTETEIPNLPNLNNILIEILPVNIPETSLSPGVIEFLKKDMPAGRVLLKKEDKSPLVWVNIMAELKQKLKLRTDLVISNGQQYKPMKSVKEIQPLSDFWKQSETNLLAQKDEEDAKRAPSGGGEAKQKRIDDLNRMAKQAKEYGVKFGEYANLAPKMLNQEYGVRVVARYDGHEVELAKTKLSPAGPSSNSTPEKK